METLLTPLPKKGLIFRLASPEFNGVAYFPFNLLTNSSARGARSSVMHPLLWLIGLLLATLVAALIVTENMVIIYILLGFVGIVLIYILLSYSFFRKANPYLLLSEGFILKKMKIERAPRGDTQSGFGTAQIDEIHESKSSEKPLLEDVEG